MSDYYESPDGRIKLYRADCLDVLPTLTGVDAVVTDPPYGIGETAGGPESNAREKGDYGVCFDDSQEYVMTVCAEAVRACILLAKCVALTPGRTNMWHYPQASDVGMFYQPAATGCSFWGRPTWQPILFYGTAPNAGEQLRALHYILTEAPSCKDHPCAKPQNAWSWLVNKSSKPASVVLDPFMGSATTGISCIRTGRSFIGIEKDPKHFQTALERIQRELAQPDMFLAPPPKRKEQPDMFLPAY